MDQRTCYGVAGAHRAYGGFQCRVAAQGACAGVVRGGSYVGLREGRQAFDKGAVASNPAAVQQQVAVGAQRLADLMPQRLLAGAIKTARVDVHAAQRQQAVPSVANHVDRAPARVAGRSRGHFG